MFEKRKKQIFFEIVQAIKEEERRIFQSAYHPHTPWVATKGDLESGQGFQDVEEKSLDLLFSHVLDHFPANLKAKQKTCLVLGQEVGYAAFFSSLCLHFSKVFAYEGNPHYVDFSKRLIHQYALDTSVQIEGGNCLQASFKGVSCVWILNFSSPEKISSQLHENIQKGISQKAWIISSRLPPSSHLDSFYLKEKVSKKTGLGLEDTFWIYQKHGNKKKCLLSWGKYALKNYLKKPLTTFKGRRKRIWKSPPIGF